MRLADVRENADVRPRDRDERGHVAVLARAHFDHEHVVRLVARAKQKLTDPDLIVLVAGSGEHALSVARREQLCEKRLGRRLPGAAGYRDNSSAEKLSSAPGQRHVRLQSVGHQHRRRSVRLHRPLQHQHRGAAPLGVGDEIVSVVTLPAQRNERVAGLERSRVGADAQRTWRRLAPTRRRADGAQRRVERYLHRGTRRVASVARATAASSNGRTRSPMI